MNESADSKKSMERAMVEAIGLLAMADAPAVPSSFKVRGHDRVTLGHDVGRRGSGPLDGIGPTWRAGQWLGWDGKGCQENTGEWVVRRLDSIVVRFLDSVKVSWRGGGGRQEANIFSNL